mmetsp:Transcript_3131/g.4556  ORF Transcript_3131/g.4556 Transcript_3131/m.4556 type:complete len:254 (-) Transcript_3131:134-895(-)
MMNRSITFLAFALLLCVSLTNAVTEEMTGSDAERELLNKRQKKAMRQANKAVHAREEDPYYYDKEPVPEPKKDMYFELIYAEKMCQNYQATLANSTQLSIGDTQSFDCELYEKAIRFGAHGGERVGNTFWTCRIAGFFDIVIEFIEFTDNAVWDCTINDYIGGDGDDDIDDTDTYIRNEGIAIGIGPFGPADRTGVLWNEFHSHTGVFAVLGGTLEAKGIRGQLEVIWDHYKMTWFHIYHVEAWNIGPQPMYW